MMGVRVFLSFSGLIIIAIGLFLYGASKETLESAFALSIDDNGLHIFRAIMGLYTGLGCLVVLGAKYTEYTKFALLLETIFFGSIGTGRLISFLVDGHIGSVSAGATTFELLMFIVCLVLLTKVTKIPAATSSHEKSNGGTL